jgi:DNA-binding NarL/FixJ family response regulator
MQMLLTVLVEAVGGSRVAGTAATEAEAKLWLEENPDGWDVALVDLVLREGSGFGVLPAARAQGGDRKIAVFSGYITEGVRRHCERLGADVVLDKSDSEALAEWLHALIRPDS